MYKKFCDAFIVSYYLQAMILPIVLFYFFNLKSSMMKHLSNPCQFKHSFWPNRKLLFDLSTIRIEKGPINNVDRRLKKYRKCVYTFFICFFFVFYFIFEAQTFIILIEISYPFQPWLSSCFWRDEEIDLVWEYGNVITFLFECTPHDR